VLKSILLHDQISFSRCRYLILGTFLLLLQEMSFRSVQFKFHTIPKSDQMWPYLL